MGTRAAFWKGDPRKLDEREWLGCTAFDGYPDGIDGIEEVQSEADFMAVVEKASEDRHFAKPSSGWPYPWDKDIFLTDYTYAFFEGKLWASCFHGGFVSIQELDSEEYENKQEDPTMQNVPAPSKYSRSQPDSIIIIQGN